eukprot:GFKZ01007868.1.p1 GENE.GFKZ01007868.1~~GFKZ01007868.1.p1  ORF type:complete len:410 (-),score=95.92 GFKZ01007868.1:96-1325(-)
MSSLRFRARFPNGTTNTVTDLLPTTPYKDLLSQLMQLAGMDALPAKVIRAGPPASVIEVGEETPIGEVLQNGECLIVEPEARGKAGRGRTKRRGGRGKTMVEKAEEKLRRRGRVGTRTGTGTGTGKRNVVGVGDIRKEKGRQTRSELGDVDDEGDEDWSLEGEWKETERRGHEGRKRKGGGKQGGAKRLKRRAAGLAKGKIREEARNGEEGVDDVGVDLVGDRKGLEDLVVAGFFNKEGEIGSGFKKSLQIGLRKREEEAKGERRYAAWLGGNYCFEEVGGGKGFKVKIQDVVGGGGWEWDMQGGLINVYPKEVLKHGVLAVVQGGGKDKLRPVEMARVSAGLFWNMVKLFGDGVEEGLKELVPGEDWGFLGDGRKRTLSKKGKESLANQKNMEEIDRDEEEDLRRRGA